MLIYPCNVGVMGKIENANSSQGMNIVVGDSCNEIHIFNSTDSLSPDMDNLVDRVATLEQLLLQAVEQLKLKDSIIKTLLND